MNKSLKANIIILILFTQIAISAYCQDFKWDNIAVSSPLQDDIAEAILQTSNGLIWIGTVNNGLWSYDGYELNYINPAWYNIPSNCFKYIISLYESTDSTIWIGTKYNGVTILNPYKGEARILSIKDNPAVSEALNRVYDFYSDSNDILWMASHKGLVMYNKASKEIKIFQTDLPPHQHNNWDPSVLRCIVPDKEDPDKLWIGGLNGLFTFDKISFQLKSFRHPANLYKDFKGMNILPVHRQYLITDILSIDHRIYLSSWGGGILEYDMLNGSWKKHIFENYTPSKSLDENIVHNLALQDDIIFFTAGTRIAKFDINDGTINFMEIPDNSKSENFYKVVAVNDHALWFSTYGQGIYRMIRSNLSKNTKGKTVLIINNICFDNNIVFSLFKNKIPDTLYLTPDNNTINLEVTLVNPLDTNAVEYQYQLTGYDHGWISNGISRNIEYSNMPGNLFTLKLRARQEGGEWTSLPNIVINKEVYFYKHRWFIIFCFALLIAIISIFYIARVKSIRIKSNIQNQMIEIKLQALQSQMNPHFTFNALNSINNFILNNNTEKASHFLTTFSRLIRQILNNSKQPLVSLTDELQALKWYIELEQLRFENRFTYNITIYNNIDQDSIRIPPLMLQPYVENAIWHGLMYKEGKGNIDISISLSDDQLLFRITDDGIGRDKAATYKSKYENKTESLGLKLSNDRIKMLYKLYKIEAKCRIVDLYDKNNDPEGTMVEIILPMITKKNHYESTDN